MSAEQLPVVEVIPVGPTCDSSPVVKSLGLADAQETITLDTKYYTCKVRVECHRDLSVSAAEAVVLVVDRCGASLLPEDRLEEPSVKLLVTLDAPTTRMEEWCWDRGFELIEFNEEPERVLEALKMHNWSNAKLKIAEHKDEAEPAPRHKKASEVSIDELDDLMSQIKAAHDLAARGACDEERRQRAEQLAMRLMQVMDSDSEDDGKV
ncbi:hypothetical protein FOL47_007698 [Perkinsus chesapeaki]|uniref:Uncharacterized protein n=1 Tax=Perkinsus chesapeaki TaxID=330153 RepID=A0A7J6LIR4_PERCH|nr:hypothetical protein FOL47_007698 [Perkinsus chesapeaki]